LRAIVYYPKSESAQKELRKRVSEIHAEFALDYIKQLQMSKEKTKKIINEIMQQYYVNI